MKRMKATIMTILFASAVLFLTTGCMQKSGGLSGDMYRKVPKESHRHYYPQGHHKETAFGMDRDCYYDIAVEAYWCQYDKPQLPQK